jgi:hypothetical protein
MRKAYDVTGRETPKNKYLPIGVQFILDDVLGTTTLVFILKHGVKWDGENMIYKNGILYLTIRYLNETINFTGGANSAFYTNEKKWQSEVWKANLLHLYSFVNTATKFIEAHVNITKKDGVLL